jgi:hypothetical protein
MMWRVVAGDSGNLIGLTALEEPKKCMDTSKK